MVPAWQCSRNCTAVLTTTRCFSTPSICSNSTARTGDPRPLEERKAKLERLLAKASAGIQYSEHLDDDGAAIFAHACKLGFEGIVSKHRERAYRSRPSRSWLQNEKPGLRTGNRSPIGTRATAISRAASAHAQNPN
jgi:hypothetical protein